MIAADKEKQSLKAINDVLVHARAMAYEGAEHGDIAWVLDIAEYLPMLMLEEGDRTSEFRESLVDLAERFPQFAVAVQRFDAK